jgi:hypothetical protein
MEHNTEWIGKLPRMRTITQCAKEVKTMDENTAISEYYIRQLCFNNKISYFKSGTKIIVNFDNLLDFLKGA